MRVLKILQTACIGVAAVASVAPTVATAQTPSTFTVIASGLQAPRGLRFGPDGALYVAEAGLGGANSSGSACAQVVPPVGPYTGGNTGRISKITSDGTRTTVASGFASSQDAFGDHLGVADVAFVNGSLYALIAGGGCSHGNPKRPNGVAWVDTDTGAWKLIADMGAFLKSHPAKYTSPDDFEPDGTAYSMIAVDGVLYVVEPNHGQVISVTTAGAMKLVKDISASEGHIVPTSIAERDGLLYVGNLNLFPIDPQWARVITLATVPPDNLAPGFDNNRAGYHIVDSKAGFTTVVAVDFGPDGLLYALELSDDKMGPSPNTGKVIRVNRSGALEEVITGLSVPTGMTFGPDGRLYISNLGAAPPGAGTILAFQVPMT